MLTLDPVVLGDRPGLHHGQLVPVEADEGGVGVTPRHHQGRGTEAAADVGHLAAALQLLLEQNKGPQISLSPK